MIINKILIENYLWHCCKTLNVTSAYLLERAWIQKSTQIAIWVLHLPSIYCRAANLEVKLANCHRNFASSINFKVRIRFIMRTRVSWPSSPVQDLPTYMSMYRVTVSCYVYPCCPEPLSLCRSIFISQYGSAACKELLVVAAEAVWHYQLKQGISSALGKAVFSLLAFCISPSCA